MIDEIDTLSPPMNIPNTITPNQVTIDWDFNTYELAILIKPERVLLDEMDKPDHGTMSEIETEKRAKFEKLRQKIIKYLRDVDYNKL